MATSRTGRARTIAQIKADPQPNDVAAIDTPDGTRFRMVTSRHTAFVSYLTTASKQGRRTCNLKDWPESLKGWRAATKKETHDCC